MIFPAVTKNTITDYDELMKELELTLNRGYAIDFEEETPGVRCVAVAFSTGNGQVAGALSISASALSMKEEDIPRYAEVLSEACAGLVQYAHLFPGVRLASKLS